MVQNEEMSTDQECNLIDVNGDSEPEYGVMAIDVVQINNVELLKAAGGQPRSLSIQLRSGNSFLSRVFLKQENGGYTHEADSQR